MSASRADSTAPAAAAFAPGTLVTLRCERMLHGGVCAARHDALGNVLVEHAIPGELVEARLRFRTKRTWFATVERVLESSPDRVDAPCRYVPECGGCQLQHVAYNRQLALKREVVTDALRREHVEVPAATAVYGMEDPWAYRIRGEFHVVRDPAGSAPGLGFNRSRSWRPIAVDDCLIHDRRITGALPQLRELAHTAGTPALRTLHVTAGDDGDLLLQGSPRDALRAEAAVAPDGVPWTTEWTTLRWNERVYRARSDTFIQVNWRQMDVLYARVLAALGEYAGTRIVDGYAGIGVLACALAAQASEVVCIESNRAAARAGVLNARVNEVADRVRYVAATTEHALPDVAAHAPVDSVILDPPRAGCDARVTAWLALAGAPRVVYVSCDPATLARDLHVLVASGPYRIESLDVVDMFPHTYHVECVVGLNRESLPAQT